MGFADASRAERLLGDLGGSVAALEADVLVTALAAAADPDLALAGLVRVLGAAADPAALRTALREEEDFRDPLTAVLGVSAGLADHLARHPGDCELLRGTVTRPSPAGLRQEMLNAVGPASGEHQVAALAAAYRRRLLHLAARDLTDAATVDEAGEELADIAAAVLEAALAVARAELAGGFGPAAAGGQVSSVVPPGASRAEVPVTASCRLAVVAMGKCGGRELNYCSDVDVIFVAEPAEGADE